MKRVLISLLNFRPGMIGGTETYLKALIQHLPEVMSNTELRFLVSREHVDLGIVPAELAICTKKSITQLVQERICEAIGFYRAKDIERIIEEFRPDVILFPQHSVFPKGVLGRWKNIVVVHDVQHLTRPEAVPFAERVFRYLTYERFLRKADSVICISDYTRQMLVKSAKLTATNMVVIPHGLEKATINESLGRPYDRSYVYYPAGTFLHKNHDGLLRSIATLKEQGLWTDLVVFSGKQTDHWQVIKKLIRQLGLIDDVVHEGFVSRERVQQLYRHAKVILIPSLHEGFGLPVYEAVTYEKSALLSRLPVYEELGVPSECLIDFADPSELRGGMECLSPLTLSNPPGTWYDVAKRYRNELIS